MTYDTLIQKVKLRTSGIIKDWESQRSEKVYSAINDSMREIANRARFTTKQATLSIISGQTDYTVSTAIATDVGEIYQIQIPTGEIIGKTLSEFEDIKTRGALDESGTNYLTGIPTSYVV